MFFVFLLHKFWLYNIFYIFINDVSLKTPFLFTYFSRFAFILNITIFLAIIICNFFYSFYTHTHIHRQINIYISNIFFCRECRVATPQWRAQNDGIAEDLWNQTCRLLHLKPDKDFATFLKMVSCQIADK